MIQRSLTPRLLGDLGFFPVIAIIGPRQVGKTTLARSLENQIGKPTLYLDLEWEDDRSKLADAGAYLLQHQGKCVIIDEVQIMPRLFPLLRVLVDKQREPARFILLGSASPSLIKESAESLAGRIAYHELTPFTLLEVAAHLPMRAHWYRGGFPEAYLAPDDDFSRRWMTQFFTTFIERDLSEVLGWDVNGADMLRLVRMLGHLHAQMLNVAQMSSSLNLSMQTVNKYLNLLEGAFLTLRLEPYFKNIGKRLTKSPKFYFRDSGFYHAVARFRDFEDLLGSPHVGASWEGYVIEQVRRVGGRDFEYYFYRTQNGAEVDLLLITPTGKLCCIEIKYSNSPVISKGFYRSCKDLSADFRYVITPDSERYVRADGLVVCGLEAFLSQEMPLA